MNGSSVSEVKLTDTQHGVGFAEALVLRRLNRGQGRDVSDDLVNKCPGTLRKPGRGGSVFNSQPVKDKVNDAIIRLV